LPQGDPHDLDHAGAPIALAWSTLLEADLAGQRAIGGASLRLAGPFVCWDGGIAIYE
jgi:hypothetical protein